MTVKADVALPARTGSRTTFTQAFPVQRCSIVQEFTAGAAVRKAVTRCP